ncbi:MAG TPA: hypothetical protein VGG60_12160 [Candidatus Binataceae bacterium]
MAEIDRDDEAQLAHPEAADRGPLNGLKKPSPVRGDTGADNEVVRLLREMRHDMAKLMKISAKASRRNKAHLDYLEKTNLSRRWGLALLIVIAVLMVIQILQMAGYGPGSGNGDDNNTQTLQRIRTHSQTLERIHTAG